MRVGRTNTVHTISTDNKADRRRRRAFTLIELLIVIAILLAIGGLVVVNLIPRGEQAKADLQRVQFDLIDGAMKQFRVDMVRWPTEEEGLDVLWRQDALEDEEDYERWRGPYLETPILEDYWGGELTFRNPSEELGEGQYDIVSFGPDGEEGTEDDITNHDRLRDAEGEISEDLDFGDMETGGGAAPGP
jgi:general secretion pathway protein G